MAVIVIDESHYLKNYSSKRTLAVQPLLQGAQRAILLSGTPALSRPSELFPQIKCLGEPAFNVWHEFALRYCAAYKVNKHLITTYYRIVLVGITQVLPI